MHKAQFFIIPPENTNTKLKAKIKGDFDGVNIVEQVIRFRLAVTHTTNILCGRGGGKIAAVLWLG